MSKRKLNSRYKALINYVNGERLRDWTLIDILKEAAKEGDKPFDYGNPLWNILEDLYKTILTDDNTGNLAKTIVDIYNGNYELEETKTYWQLKISGIYGNPMYAFEFDFPTRTIGIVSKNNDDTISKFTKDEFIDALSNTITNLTIDNFTPVEEIDND